MAAILAHDGAPADWHEQPPPRQFQLDFPVLFDGHRPPERRTTTRRRKPRNSGETPVQLSLHDLLEQLCAEDAAADRAANALDAIEGDATAQFWEEDEVYVLHLGLLERSLEVLADTRTSAATVAEIVDWVREAPDSNAPGLSYRRCCELAGYDADELAEQLIDEVRRLHGIAVV